MKLYEITNTIYTLLESSLLDDIRRLSTGSEPIIALFSNDPDNISDLAYMLDRDVSEKEISLAREEIRQLTVNSLQNAPNIIKVYRGGEPTGDIIPVTTNKAVATSFTKRSQSGKLYSYNIPKNKIIADISAINPYGGFDESEFLVNVESLK
jgi:hypothetical protein